MRWLSLSLALSLAMLLGWGGCGGSTSSSRLTMQFMEFNGDGIAQEDNVFQNSAQVDVCQTLCQAADIFTNVVFEEFTQTTVNAVFVNNGKADILLDTYTVEIVDSGIDPITQHISATLTGGRCSNAPDTACASNRDCATLGGTTILGQCLHTESTVGGLLLFGFGIKEEILPGQCPVCDFRTGDCSQGTKVPQAFDVIVTFSGTDTTDKRFTISAGYVADFFDANNCMATTQPG